MYKIKFFKNNNEEIINQNEIEYLKEELIVKKTTDDSVISLDFKHQKCEFKIDDIVIEIPVIEMSFNLDENTDTFYYTLVSEPDIKNAIIIHKIK